MQTLKRLKLTRFLPNYHFKLTNYRFCTTSNPIGDDPDDDNDSNCLWLQLDENKHILVMGVFHHSYSHSLIVQNAITTLQPSTVFLELCPWRGMQLETIQKNYCKTYHYSPRDVESSAIFSASLCKSNIIYGDVPEATIKRELSKYTNREISQISMHEFYYDDDEFNMDDIYLKTDQNGKRYIINENNEECDVESRSGVRELMRLYSQHLDPNIRRILYDDREKYMIKSMYESIKNKKEDKVIAIVGMAHLDGIHKYWQDELFWNDKEFWDTKITKIDKWETRRYGRLLSIWMTENFTRVPRFVPKILKMGGDNV